MTATTFSIPASRAGVGSVVITSANGTTYNIADAGVVNESNGGGGGGGAGGGAGIYIGGLWGFQFRPA